MHINWTIDVGTVLAILVPVIGGGIAAVRQFVLYLRTQVSDALVGIQRVSECVADLSEDVSGLKAQLIESSREARELRTESNIIGHRLTRIETLIEVMIPNAIEHPNIRSTLRDSVRDALQAKEQQEPQEIPQ